MEMYANGSSFKANLTLQTRTNYRDVSFSSYLNKADENMVRRLTKKPEEDEEIGVFGAEKYFKGEIEDGGNKNDLRFVNSINNSTNMHLQEEKFDQTNMRAPSVRSNVSCNSRSSMLPRNETKTKTFLGRFGCDCMNKKSIKINEKVVNRKADQTNMCTPSVRSNVSCNTRMKTDEWSRKLTDTKSRNGYFSFPVLNSNDLNSNSSSNSNSKSGNLAGKVEVVNNDVRLSRMYIPSSRLYNNDSDSDSSSDLFEIESFSPARNSPVLSHRKTESNCYAPSEVSIEWSVVTASAADFSVVSDYEEVGTGGSGRRNSGRNGGNKDEQKKRPGILSGCTSHKAVRVAGDEYKIGGGGAGGRRRLEVCFEGG